MLDTAGGCGSMPCHQTELPMDIIDPIGDMFRNEDLFRTMKLSGEQIGEKRLKLTGPILERIHHKVVMMMQDAKLMANELMRKAVNYTLNQWKSLSLKISLKTVLRKSRTTSL